MLTLPNASYLELLACLDIGSNSFIVDFFGPMSLCSNSRLELPTVICDDLLCVTSSLELSNTTGVDLLCSCAFLSFVFSVLYFYNGCISLSLIDPEE